MFFCCPIKWGNIWWLPKIGLPPDQPLIADFHDLNDPATHGDPWGPMGTPSALWFGEVHKAVAHVDALLEIIPCNRQDGDR